MYLLKVIGINTKTFKKIIFVGFLIAHWRKEQDPDSLHSLRIRGSGSVSKCHGSGTLQVRIRINTFLIRNTNRKNFSPLVCPGGDKHWLFSKQGYKNKNYRTAFHDRVVQFVRNDLLGAFSAVLLTEDQTRVVRRERVANSNNLGNSWNSETGNCCLSG